MYGSSKTVKKYDSGYQSGFTSNVMSGDKILSFNLFENINFIFK